MDTLQTCCETVSVLKWYCGVSTNIDLVHVTLQLKVSPILMHLRKYYPRKRIWHPARARYRSGEILVNNHLSGNTNGVPECSMVKFQTTGKILFLLWMVFIIMKVRTKLSNFVNDVYALIPYLYHSTMWQILLGLFLFLLLLWQFLWLVLENIPQQVMLLFVVIDL